MFEIIVNILLTILGFALGFLVSNICWRAKVDNISKRLLDATEAQMMKTYEKDKMNRRN